MLVGYIQSFECLTEQKYRRIAVCIFLSDDMDISGNNGPFLCLD